MSEIGPQERPTDLGQTDTARPAPPPTPPHAAPAPGSPSTTAGFDFNRPTIIALLYLASAVLGVTGLVGLVLAYVWKGETHAEWEASHYQYLINTFWIGLVGTVVGLVLALVLIGFVVLLAVAVLVVVRCVLSLINAQKQIPMPNPSTLLA